MEFEKRHDEFSPAIIPDIAERLTEIAGRAKATFANADSTEDASLSLAELAVELERLVTRFRYRSVSE